VESLQGHNGGYEGELMAVITCVEDLRVIAKRGVPRMFATTRTPSPGSRALTALTTRASRRFGCASVSPSHRSAQHGEMDVLIRSDFDAIARTAKAVDMKPQ